MNRKLRILVADDSVNLRKVIQRYIVMAYDAEFVEAGNGEEAEAALQESLANDQPLDIIFLDWMMPKVSGFEFLSRIRSTEVFKQFPEVIMLTAETYSEQINACLKYNVSSYVTKPFTQEELHAAIRKIIDGKGLRDAV